MNKPLFNLWQRLPRETLLTPVAVLTAWAVGSAIAAGGRLGFLALAAGTAVMLGMILGALFRSRLRWDFAAVELPVLLIILSGLVLRQRDAESLASNPLDAAGLYRVGCIGLALLLGLLALTSPISTSDDRITTRPFRLYCLYVLIVFVGAPLSINLPLTAYRGIELLTGVIVLAGAYRRAGKHAIDRILSLLFWVAAVSAMVVWVGAAIVPGSSFSPVDSPFPIQLHGVFPVISANGTGTLGALLGLWSLARLLSESDQGAVSRRTLVLLSVLGFVTLIFAQYRTGYVIIAVGLVVILLFRARAAASLTVVAGILVAATWGGWIAHQAAPILQRGENPEVLRSLSGRLDYWSAALPVWKESPLFGSGLLTGSRFEVLAKLGATYTSTIHGTWVEALVGTGVIGVALLAASVIITLSRALGEAIRPHGRIVPLLLLAILLVRSITGATFEVAGTDSLLLLTIALLLRDRSPGRANRADFERVNESTIS